MKKIIAVLFFSLAFFTRNHAQVFSGGPGENPRQQRYSFSLAVSSGYSMFHVDTRESTKATPRLGGGAMFRMDFRVKPSWLHLQAGLELMSQGCVFNTYYFSPGYSTLYDKSYGYDHTLRTVELYTPVIARIGITPDETANLSQLAYFLFGWSPKIFLGSSSSVTDNATGKMIWGGPTVLTYETSIFGDQTGSVAMIGYGYEKLLSERENFLTFETIFRYSFSRFIYTGNYDTNNLLIKSACLSVQIGYRFMGAGRDKSGKPKK